MNQNAIQYRTSSNLESRIALHARFSTNPYPWMRWVFDHLALPPVCRVLELGAGTGSLWATNQERIPAGWDITLSDFSPGMLAQARENLAAVPRPFAFKVVDAQAIPFADGTFDAVIANHMLYHVPDLPRALAEIQRVLKPGGVLFASTVGGRHMAEMWALLRRVRPRIWETNQDVTASFNLETGMEHLYHRFGELRLFEYEDSLNITEVEPLVAYLLSSQILQADPLSEAELCALRSEIAARITAEGAIHITKATCLFAAGNRPRDDRNTRALFSPSFSVNPMSWQHWLFDHMTSLSPVCRVLDVGVGLASLWVENRDRIPEGWDITLCDFSWGNLNAARVSLGIKKLRIIYTGLSEGTESADSESLPEPEKRPFSFAMLDAQALPYAEGTFDVVVANHMLYFVTDVQRALAEMRRVLKPDGVLFAATTGELHMDEMWTLVDRFFPGTGEKEHAGVRPFSLENGAAQLSAHFRRVERFDYADSFHVTKVKPLVDFIHWLHPLSREEETALSDEFAARIASEGAFHITKSWGLFVARDDK